MRRFPALALLCGSLFWLARVQPAQSYPAATTVWQDMLASCVSNCDGKFPEAAVAAIRLDPSAGMLAFGGLLGYGVAEAVARSTIATHNPDTWHPAADLSQPSAVPVLRGTSVFIASSGPPISSNPWRPSGSAAPVRRILLPTGRAYPSPTVMRPPTLSLADAGGIRTPVASGTVFVAGGAPPEPEADGRMSATVARDGWRMLYRTQ